jgi:hypothetical protein
MSDRNGHALTVAIDPDQLRPLIQAVVEETIAAIEARRAALPDRLAFSEPEAARLLGLHAHQLRDARLRGEIKACVATGKRIRYTRCALEQYLASRPWQPTPGAARGSGKS